MFQLLIKRAKPNIDRAMFWELVHTLGEKGYEPMTKVILTSAGLKFNSDLLNKYATWSPDYRFRAYGAEGVSELFFGRERHVFLVQLQLAEEDKNKGKLSAYCFFDSAATSPTVFNTFISEFNTAFEELNSKAGNKLSLQWDDIRFQTQTFKRMSEGRVHPSLDPTELKAAQVLQDKASRELLRNLKKSVLSRSQKYRI